MIDRTTPGYKQAISAGIVIGHFTEGGLWGGIKLPRKYDIEGIVHVGANRGYEIQHYLNMGIEKIVAFEPITDAYLDLRVNYPQIISVHSALGNKTQKRALRITGFDEGSSFLVPKDQPVVRTEIVNEDRLDDWYAAHVYRGTLAADVFKKCDCLVIDVQGYEYEVLEGAKQTLSQFKYLNIECSVVPIYEGGHPASDVVELLDKRGYVPMSPVEGHNDVLFLRKDML